MEQPWVSIDLAADNASTKVLSSVEGSAPAPWPELGLLAAQSELRLQLFPALDARHTNESASVSKAHKVDREALDQRYAEDSTTLEARHNSERAALVNSYKYGREGLEQRFATENADMQARQLNEIQTFLHQNLGLHKGMIAALAQQRKKQETVIAALLSCTQSHAVLHCEICWHSLQEANALAAEKASMEAPGISGGDILQLNVGGESFVVTRGTLTQVSACDQLLPATMIAHSTCHFASLQFLLLGFAHAGQRLLVGFKVQWSLGAEASSRQQRSDLPRL